MDGYGLSNFLLIANGKLVHGSPWDFDLAYGFDCFDGYMGDVETGEVHGVSEVRHP